MNAIVDMETARKVRGEGYYDKGIVRGDCTTRALAYIFPAYTYESLYYWQHEVAEKLGTWGWNYERTWGGMLAAGDYVRLSLYRKMTRAHVAALLADCGPIVSHSREHVSACDEGRIIDVWDSSRGRVDAVWLWEGYAEKAMAKLACVGCYDSSYLYPRIG